jgi:hypothetical protein
MGRDVVQWESATLVCVRPWVCFPAPQKKKKKKVKFTVHKLYLNKITSQFFSNSLKYHDRLLLNYQAQPVWVILLTSFSLPVWKRHFDELSWESARSAIQGPREARLHSKQPPPGLCPCAAGTQQCSDIEAPRHLESEKENIKVPGPC